MNEQATTANEKKPAEERSARRDLYDWIQCIVVAIIVCVLLFSFAVRLVDVVGESMLPTLEDGDKIIVSDLFYTPKQGDIIGTVEIRLAGETIGVVNLVAGQDVNRNPVLYGIAQFQAFLGSLYLKVVLALSAVALALYGLWWVQNAIREQRSWGSKHIKRR